MEGRFWIACGAVLASVAVAAGAIGTHYLKETLQWPAARLETYDVAVRYHLAHAMALIAVGLVLARGETRWLSAAGIAFLAGTVCFSGGLYAWLWTEQRAFMFPIVPLGGTTLIVGWLLLAIGAWRARRRPSA